MLNIGACQRIASFFSGNFFVYLIIAELGDFKSLNVIKNFDRINFLSYKFTVRFSERRNFFCHWRCKSSRRSSAYCLFTYVSLRLFLSRPVPAICSICSPRWLGESCRIRLKDDFHFESGRKLVEKRLKTADCFMKQLKTETHDVRKVIDKSNSPL